MGKQYDSISDKHFEFIKRQHLFFVGTAAADGRVNVSPKGLDCLRVLSPNRVVWRNLTGSGNESAAHVALNPRMTLMFCSFEEQSLVLRLYGQARVIHPRDEEWEALSGHFEQHDGSRQFYDLSVDLVQSSCGFSIPFMRFEGDRDMLDRWTERKGVEGVEGYWRDRNQQSIDGFDTHILDSSS